MHLYFWSWHSQDVKLFQNGCVCTVWVRCNIERGLLWNLLTWASLAGHKHLIDEKTAGDLMPLLLHPTPKLAHVSAPRKIWVQIETMGRKKNMVPLNFPQIHFQVGGAGDTICRMLALQKEMGLGRRWEMKMNGTMRSPEVCVWNWFHSFWPHQWCGCHLCRQVYLPQQSELKPACASLSCLPIQRWLLLLYVSNAMCRWRRQGRRFSPLMTQGADREVCTLLGYPIILNHKNRRFRLTGTYMVPASSAEDDHASIV